MTQMRVRLVLAAVLLAALPVAAQAPAGTPAADFVRPDGTLDLTAVPTGALDLSGMSVMIGADGHLRAGLTGDYTDISSGPMGASVSGPVHAVAVGPDGSLYVGGDFVTAGSTTVNYVARWDGTMWHPLGTGLNNSVRALVIAPDGSLYAGGVFTTAGGMAANRIARWDGTAWHALGSGIGIVWTDGVRALMMGPDGSLYAGGSFNFAGGTAARHVARWDGAAWSAVGGNLNGEVRALAVAPNGNLYAGGVFTASGSTGLGSIARWDGTAWRPLGSGHGGVSNGVITASVEALAVGLDGTLYVGGRFTRAGGMLASSIARWDGTAWSALGSGMTSGVLALTVRLDGLYAGGWFIEAGGTVVNRVARWDGTAWHALGSGMTTSVLALAVAPDGSLFAGGGQPSSVGAHDLAQWDGSEWRQLGSSVNGSVRAVVVGPDGSYYVGGTFTRVGGIEASRIARWDGTAWHPLGSGVDNTVYALATGPDGSLYAGGSFRTAGGTPAVGIARWDGMAWSPLGTGIGTGIYTLAVAPDGILYVGGGFSPANSTMANYVARWDGTAWSPLGSGMNNIVWDLLVAPDGSLYAGGNFTTAGGVGASYVARWDGTAWHPLGTGVTNGVSALAMAPDGMLYAGGWFTTAGGTAANRVARWNGTTWSALGSGMSNGGITALALGPDGGLYAGGSFRTAGGTPATYLAQWYGTAWSPVGSSMNNPVYALAMGPDGRLYAGGNFSVAGGIVSPYITRYTPTGPPVPFVVTSPDAATIAYAGRRLRVTWTTPDLSPWGVRVFLRRGDGAWNQIYTGPDRDGVGHDLPMDTPPGTDYQVRVEDAADPSRFDVSERFTITSLEQVFHVLRPAPFQRWALGTTRDIHWTSPAGAPAGDVVLELTRRLTGEVVYADTTANDGAEPFPVDPAYGDGQYVWRIRSAANGAFAGASALFSLGAVEITSPSEPTTWTVGQTQTVLWEAPTVVDPAAFARVALRRLGFPSILLAPSTGNDGAFSFPVPDVAPAADYYVQVRVFTEGTFHTATSRHVTLTGGSAVAERPLATRHFASPVSPADVTVAQQVSLSGLGAAEEVAVYDGDRLVGAARVTGGAAVVDVLGVAVDAERSSAEAEAYVVTAPGTPLSVVVWSAREGERGLALAEALVYTADVDVSAVATGSVAAGGADPAAAGEFALTGVSPNPTSGTAVVRFTLPVAQAVTVRVYDVLGRVVAVLVDGEAAAGAHAVSTPAGLPAGVYLVRVAGGGASASQRFTIIR